MDLEGIMLSEIKPDKERQYMILFTCGGKKQTH